jgi:hypothetical protein
VLASVAVDRNIVLYDVRAKTPMRKFMMKVCPLQRGLTPLELT